MRYPRNGLLLCTLYMFFMGCQSTKESSYIGVDIGSFRGKKISAVTLKNGEIRKYDKVGGRYYEEKRDSGLVRQIVGLDAMGASLNIDLNRILEVQCQTTETDGGGIILTVVFVAAGAVILLGVFLASGFRE